MTLESIILVVHVLLAFSLIGLILIQHGKGADAGAAFGSGASGTVFGSSGSGSFLTKLTTWIAIAFFATSIGLAYIAASKHVDKPKDAFELPTTATEQPAPAQPNDLPTISEPAQSDLPTGE